MKSVQVFLVFLLTINIALSQVSASNKSAGTSSTDYVELSQGLLYAARTDENITLYLDTLRRADADDLSDQLKSNQQKLAFWLNIYNAFTQIMLKNDPDQYNSRGAFYNNKKINIAENMLSLDMIEHGILRRSKIKWALGYLKKPFVTKFERKFRVQKLDYRIHFALNCGAKSCPPIAFYDPDDIEMQLELAMSTYLTNEAEFDLNSNLVKLPSIMSWFRGDFGGKTGIVSLLKKLEIIPTAASSPKIEFKKYDWTLFLNNYKP